VTWKSSAEDVATVNHHGTITGLREGSAEISATTASRKPKSATITVAVVPPSPATALSLAPRSVDTDETITVSALVTPAVFTNILTWTIADSSIAAILPFSGNKCQLTGITAGATTLTVTTDTGKSASCNITVIQLPAGAVRINGIVWATRNVDAPGTFAATPESAGMLYKWNRKIGWSATDPMVSSNGVTTWDKSVPSGKKWTAGNDPSPSGWRVPTKEEQLTLLDTEKVTNVRTTQNGVKGKLFTDEATGKTLFLPAAGYRDYHDGALVYAGRYGYYWSRTQYETKNAYYLLFNFDYKARSGSDVRHFGHCVRPVLHSIANYAQSGNQLVINN
jgi:uncharacterized protein (TIGR02145 family)